MRKRTKQDLKVVETSSLLITRPENFELLEQQFQLFEYIIPETWKGRERYQDVHIEAHHQLVCPYRFWTYAPVGPTSDDTGWAIYTLIPPDVQPTSMAFGDHKVEPIRISIGNRPLHLVVKLLMEDYFRGEADQFTGEGKHYQFARWENRAKNAALCLEFDLSAAQNNQDTFDIQEFHVSAGARRFRLERDAYVHPARNIYYARTPGRDTTTFSLQMLRREEAAQRLSQGKELWSLWSDSSNRTRLAFIEFDKLESSRGYLLNRFCLRFAQRLSTLGIPTRVRERTFKQYPAAHPRNEQALDLKLDGATFYLLDARHKKRVPLEYYQERLTLWFVENQCQFMPISEDILATNTHDGPTILLMDADKEYYENGISDPYNRIYSMYPAIPLQGFNVNPNDLSSANYLGYTEWESDGSESNQEENYRQRAQLVIRDALLKHFILRELPINNILPSLDSLSNYLYVYRGLYQKLRYLVFAYTENGVLKFSMVNDSEGWNALDSACRKFDVTWDDLEQALRGRRGKFSFSRSDKEFDFLVVIGRGVASEIVDVQEYALHNFDQIHERLEKRRAKQPIEYFYAVQHYDSYAKVKGWPTSDIIREMNLEGPGLLSDRLQNALAFRNSLRKHDEFIEDIALRTPRISWDDLRKNEEYKRALHSAGLTERKVLDVFNSAGELISPRRTDAIFYEGIWFDETDQTYMVGSPDAMTQKGTKNAHSLRRFEPLLGCGVALEDMLQLMAVGFVRLNRYTVVPFPFKLLRLYIENYGHWIQVE